MQVSIAALDIGTLLAGYRSQKITPRAVIEHVFTRIAQAREKQVWITRLRDAQVFDYVRVLEQKSPQDLPLYGIPFVIKDNIDLAGVPTTAACPAHAYTPERSAYVVQRLIDAGAIPLGKTNLDQFATGLVGTRSPYGACRNAFNGEYISGGSSSGSAVALAMGLASFSLGTDTAGSGRVPAAFNNLIGLKPARGLLSTSGVVPACRSLDCVSIFALTSADAARVLQVAQDYDATDAYARQAQDVLPFSQQHFRFGVPAEKSLQFFGDSEYARLFHASVARLEALGGTRVEIDFEPFLQTARLLYTGPWIAERYLAIRERIEHAPETLLPVTRQIIGAGTQATALDTFSMEYRRRELKRASEAAWKQTDVIVTPTTGTIYRIAQVEADPIQLNSNLGYYTNFMNLLDLSAVAVPAGFRADGLPFGVSLFAPAFNESNLLALADKLQRASVTTPGALNISLPNELFENSSTRDVIAVAVCGAHLEGLALNHQLTSRGARLLQRTRSAPYYRLYALPGGPPQRSGLIRTGTGGAAIEVEVWSVPAQHFGSFVAQIPAPLCIGKLELADGVWVSGFICETYAITGAQDITSFGGWRAYLEFASGII
ncbi:MAG: allophanate hydrolase [Gammaproteobacteria bacterium]|nr:allophanate hydrolase [Gammaproteobacteria bacterium]